MWFEIFNFYDSITFGTSYASLNLRQVKGLFKLSHCRKMSKKIPRFARNDCKSLDMGRDAAASPHSRQVKLQITRPNTLKGYHH